jgi:NNP family nitrate/nitrite transporter-like MFS transporter
MIDASWSPKIAMGVVVMVGFFLMAGNGANFCIAPLIRKPLTGQIAGLIGAYGSVGSVAFLAILLVGGPKIFFITMTITAVAGFICTFALREPGRQPRRVVEETSEITPLPLAIESA